ncbi:unnamed protein product [Camellia sinensis]
MEKQRSFASPYAVFRGRGTTYQLDTVVKLHVCSGIFHNIFSLLEPITNHISAQQLVLKFYPMAQMKTAKRLISSFYSRKAQSIIISTRVVNLYANLGDVPYSRCTFNQIPKKDAYTWNSMLSSYVRSTHFHEAVNCLYKMLMKSEVRPDFYSFPPVLKACGNLFDGKKIHAGFLNWVLNGMSLWLLLWWICIVTLAILLLLHKVFSDMPFRDRGSWNAMISGFCQNGKASEALGVLDEMRFDGMKMDCVTVSTILPACAQMDDILHGMLIHLYIIKHGLEFDVFMSNALINMYAKFGNIWQAQKVFNQMFVRDLVSWNSIIAAYEQNTHPDTALKFYGEMQSNGIQPDVLTLVSLVSSVAQSRDCRNVGNAVVDLYAKLGIIDSAYRVFEEIRLKDVVSWNMMITGYGQNGLASEAIEVLCTMEACEDVTPNQGTWVSVLPAYSHLGALKLGMRTHWCILKASLHLDVYVGTCLIDLCGKCGRLDDAMSLFYEVPRMSSVLWNAIISCHGIHGRGETSMQLFQAMQDEGVKPDHVTFVSLLSSCSHSGLVGQGQWCFRVMQDEYGIEPSLKYYGCTVDLLGRAGYLEKAFSFVKNMPLRPDASVWGALLGACRIHGNIELGKFASDCLFEVDSENVGCYVLLSNIYANVGKWEGVDEVRSLAGDHGLKNTWIYKELEVLTAKIKSIGYILDNNFVLQDVEEDEKEYILVSHSERLAIVYGIISTPPTSPIRIFKNLSVCGNCHNVTKFISKITEREIIVRDSNRFHHFKDGICSCGDYWGIVDSYKEEHGNPKYAFQ